MLIAFYNLESQSIEKAIKLMIILFWINAIAIVIGLVFNIDFFSFSDVEHKADIIRD